MSALRITHGKTDDGSTMWFDLSRVVAIEVWEDEVSENTLSACVHFDDGTEVSLTPDNPTPGWLVDDWRALVGDIEP